MSIGVPSYDDTFSMVHYAERKHDAQFRRLKLFSGIYVGWDGKARLKTYGMSVRKTLRHITRVEPMYPELIDKGIVTVTRVLDAAVSWFWTKPYVKAVGWYVKNEPEKLHYVKGIT